MRLPIAPELPPIKPPAPPEARLARHEPPRREFRYRKELPHAFVAAGVIVAIAIVWRVSHEDAAHATLGAKRIEAATGARMQTAQAVTPLDQALSARQALQSLYGNYDPNLDGAFWTISGAPSQWASWNGRSVLVRPLLSRSDDSGTRHVLVTNTLDVKGGMVVKQGSGCAGCKSLLGVAEYQRTDGEWKLVSEQRFFAVEGAWGAPPQVAATFPTRGGVELKVAR